MQKFDEEIIDVFNGFGIKIDKKASKNLMIYYEALLEYNFRFNLTAITEFKEVLIKHFLDSAAVIKFCPNISSENIIDVGTGAGFPGIIIAALCNDAKVTLVEASQKKTEFLQAVKRKLSLNNVEILNSRIEDVGRDANYRESFDLSLSRAVAKLSVLAEYLLPLVSVGRGIICYKSGNYKEELLEADNAISILGGEYRETFSYKLPEDMGDRSLILINKIREADSKYPRRTGIPAKRPL